MMDTKEMGGFAFFLFASSFPLSLLFSLFTALSTSLGFHLLTLSLLYVLLYFPLKQEQYTNKGEQRIIIHKNVVEFTGCPNTEKVRHPDDMSSSTNAGFLLAYITVVQWFHWVHTEFNRTFHTAKKNTRWLINTRHVLVNSGCRLKIVYAVAALAGHHHFVGRKQKNSACPSCLQYSLNVSILKKKVATTVSQK